MGNQVKQEEAEKNEEKNDSQPGQDEIAFVVAGRRRGDSEDKMHAAEDAGEEFDHANLLFVQELAIVLAGNDGQVGHI